jgi:KaiC/GvpD/RAD55 family RecA-like ATPase
MYTEVSGIIERVQTGIEGLDEMIEGGLPKESITLVSGPPGSGKSIFCFQFLYQGIKQNERCLFLTLDKKVEGLLVQTKKLQFDFQPAIEQKLIRFLFLNIAKKMVYETMTDEILNGNYDRIVLDSITPLSELPIYSTSAESSMEPPPSNGDTSVLSHAPIRRMHLQYILHILETSKSTSVITSELPSGQTMLSRDGISEFLADGVIIMSLDPTMDRRKLSVMKMRNTKHTLKPRDIELGEGGIRFL